ncbi:hypothetical protein ACI0FM_03065 [Paenochrobactrum sp. BZR 588]|uniref:hypothetical protein n=1 Tax=unclassified Paenochrobactrum TaxID=2639760 RepID=UPI0038546DCF
MPFITDISWRPSTYRAAHRAWSLNSTETDGAMMPKQRQSKRKLTADQVKRFAPLRMFLSGVPASALTSNWNIIPDNDNRTETDSDDEDHNPISDWKPERSHDIIPSIGAIESAIADIEVCHRKEPSMLSGGRLEAMRPYRNEEAIIIGGDFERNQHGQIVRIGNLQFAGEDEYGINPTEWVECVGDAGAVMFKRLRMRTGAMMHSKERRDDIKETTDAEALKASNDYYLNFVLPSPKRGKVKPKVAKRPRCDMSNPPLPPTSLSFEEARAWAGLPYMKKDSQAALPAAPKHLADLFIGCKKSDCHGGSQAWADISTALVGKEQWTAAMSQLTKTDIVSLNAVRDAQTYADIGKAHGHTGSYAEKAGKRLLMAANDNLGEIIKKVAV